jgi:hypothetical protein
VVSAGGRYLESAATLVSTRLADKLGTHVSASVPKHPPLFYTHTHPPIIALALTIRQHGHRPVRLLLKQSYS